MDKNITVFMFLLQIIHHVPFMGTFTLNLDYNMMKEAIGQWVPTKFEQYTHSNALGWSAQIRYQKCL